MANQLTDATLDTILAMQIAVAWAGEARCDPPRLGWWDTDVVDPDGGGDLLARLLPKTHAWAGLELAREAARRTDAKARAKMASPDSMRSLFFLGFDVDEQLTDRLAALKRSGSAPDSALSFPLELTSTFSRDAFVKAVSEADSAFTVVPGGRQIKGKPPASPDALVRRLAASLTPLAEQYPLPFFRVEA